MVATGTQSVSGLVRRLESDGRHDYHDREDKLTILREALTQGASLAKGALRHGINANLLHKWIAHARLALIAERASCQTPTRRSCSRRSDRS